MNEPQCCAVGIVAGGGAVTIVGGGGGSRYCCNFLDPGTYLSLWLTDRHKIRDITNRREINN